MIDERAVDDRDIEIRFNSEIASARRKTSTVNIKQKTEEQVKEISDHMQNDTISEAQQQAAESRILELYPCKNESLFSLFPHILNCFKK